MDQTVERVLEQFSLLHLHLFPENISTFVIGNRQQIVEDVAEFNCAYLLSNKDRSITTTGVATLTAYACCGAVTKEAKDELAPHASIVLLNYKHNTGALLLRLGRQPVAFYRAHFIPEDTADNIKRVARDIRACLAVDPDVDINSTNPNVATLIISTTSIPTVAEIVEKLGQVSPIWK